MNVLVDAVDGLIEITSQWSDKERIKALPGSRWNDAAKKWTVPLTWTSCVQLRGVFGNDLVLGDALRFWAKAEKEIRIDPSLDARNLLSLPANEKFSWTAKMYPFQRAGMAFMAQARQALLGDDMGTGKTIQALSTLRLLHETSKGGLPALVVSPNSMKGTWKREAGIWFPQAVAYVVEGSAVQRRKTLDAAAQDANALVIINFESVRGHSRTAGYGSINLARCGSCEKNSKVKENACEVHERELNKIPFSAIVVDEAHRMKDAKAKQTRAIWAVGSNPTVKYRYAMTGTAVEKNTADIWPVMHFIAPNEYPVKSKFLDRYCEVSFNSWGGIEIGNIKPEMKDEFRKVFHPRFRRMTKAMVLPDLPPKVFVKRFVQMTKEQTKMYDQMESQLVSRLPDGSLLVAKANIAANTRLLQFSSASMVKTGEKVNTETGEMEDVYTMTDPSPKLDAMEEIIDEMGGKQLVIAAHHTQLVNLAVKRLEKLGVKYAVLTGETPLWQREMDLVAFKKGEIQVFIFTIQAGGVGITLNSADTILFLQRSWSNTMNKQAVDRVHRIGSEKFQQVTIIDLVAEGTIEEHQIEAIHRKEAKAQDVLEDDKAMEKLGFAA